jgi:hypothetical protein
MSFREKCGYGWQFQQLEDLRGYKSFSLFYICFSSTFSILCDLTMGARKCSAGSTQVWDRPLPPYLRDYAFKNQIILLSLQSLVMSAFTLFTFINFLFSLEYLIVVSRNLEGCLMKCMT